MPAARRRSASRLPKNSGGLVTVTFTGEVIGLRIEPRTVKVFESTSRWIHSPSSFERDGVVLLVIFTKLQAGSVRVTSAPRGDGLAKKPRQFRRKFSPAISAQYSSCS